MSRISRKYLPMCLFWNYAGQLCIFRCLGQVACVYCYGLMNAFRFELFVLRCNFLFARSALLIYIFLSAFMVLVPHIFLVPFCLLPRWRRKSVCCIFLGILSFGLYYLPASQHLLWGHMRVLWPLFLALSHKSRIRGTNSLMVDREMKLAVFFTER